MPVLANPKHERFAQELARGATQAQAYTDAGYNASLATARSCAHKLFKKADIQARIDELLAEQRQIESGATQRAIDALAIDRAWVMERLVLNAERALQQVEVRGPDGEPLGEFRYEGSVANKALELLGREIGMYQDRRPQQPLHLTLNVFGSVLAELDGKTRGLPPREPLTIEHEPAEA